MKNTARWFFPALLTALLTFSCATRTVVIADHLTPMELIQRGQEASDRNRFSVALQFYRALLERFPYDIDSRLAAEYEIAFIYYKQRDFNTAREKFEALLERYDTPDSELLPPQFKVLAGIVLARISEAENNRRRR